MGLSGLGPATAGGLRWADPGDRGPTRVAPSVRGSAGDHPTWNEALTVRVVVGGDAAAVATALSAELAAVWVCGASLVPWGHGRDDGFGRLAGSALAAKRGSFPGAARQ